MICFPNAKINIGLNITEKRKDGFHNIETVLYPIGLSDVLEVVENTAGSKNIFHSTGIKIPGNANENICLKAYALLAKDYKIPPVKIHLHKIIPIGAGLGGGSSDAAHFIHLLDNLFSLKISLKKKLHYAAQLGSDCSFFIKNKPSFAYGRGEKLQSSGIFLRGYYLVLVCPPVHVSTKDAYADVKLQKPESSLRNLVEMPLIKFTLKNETRDGWKENIFNQFEETGFKKYPSIKKIKELLYHAGAIYASMSGSGSAVYGIFYSPLDEKMLHKNFKNCVVWQEWIRK